MLPVVIAENVTPVGMVTATGELLLSLVPSVAKTDAIPSLTTK
jgi:hypothetical protein